MADRDIPSVPVTTLAGLASVSDCKSINNSRIKRVFSLPLHFDNAISVLSELPISDSSVGTPLNKSLLFHPRVAEEAKNLLCMKDDALTRQLIQALEQTNSDHM